MAPEKEIDGDTMLLLHIIHKDNPTLSGGNWPAISAKMGQPAERIRYVTFVFLLLLLPALAVSSPHSQKAQGSDKGSGSRCSLSLSLVAGYFWGWAIFTS